MTTTADLIARTQRHLLTGSREEMNQLAASYTSGAGTMTFSHPVGGIKAGASLAVGLELFYVFSVSDTGTANVLGGQQGTTLANHSSGDLVTVNPKFSAFDVLNALNNDLADISAQGIYQVKSVDITYLPPVYAYDLTGATDVFNILDIHWSPIGPTKAWPLLTHFDLDRGQDTSVFASGYALKLYEVPQPGRQMRVRYSAPLGSLSTLTDDVTTVTGLPATAMDIPPLGAAIELVAGREVKRNFTEAQGDTRRAGEVPPGASMQSTRGLMLRHAQRIDAESTRLTRNDPMVIAAR